MPRVHHTISYLAHADAAHRKNRWTPARKEAVLIALRRNEITFADACARYDLTPGELIQWQEGFRVAGRSGLAVTKEVGR